MKLLLAEDDARLAQYLVHNLKASGYVVEWVDNGVDAEFLALEEDFDGIILDLGLPQKPGLEVLRHWRQQALGTPVLILTARDSWPSSIGRRPVSVRTKTTLRPSRQSQVGL